MGGLYYFRGNFLLYHEKWKYLLHLVAFCWLKTAFHMIVKTGENTHCWSVVWK